MPIYSWKCVACGETTQAVNTMKDSHVPPRDGCEVCGGQELKKLIDNPKNVIVGGRSKGDIYAGGIKPV